MRIHKSILLFAVSSLMALSAVSCGNAKSEKSDGDTAEVVADKNGYIVKVGDVAPDFETTTITGENFKLSDYRGKVVMLQFTASWCRVCREEMPHIEKEIWLEHKGNPNFVLFAVDREETIEDATLFVRNIGITYPMLLDTNGDVFAKYAVREAGVTRNVLIDKDGKIMYMTRLYDPIEFSGLKKAIDNLVN